MERLSRVDTARFMILLQRVRWLTRRMEAANLSMGGYGFDIAGTKLKLTISRWLACHEAISALLDCPEPQRVA